MTYAVSKRVVRCLKLAPLTLAIIFGQTGCNVTEIIDALPIANDGATYPVSFPVLLIEGKKYDQHIISVGGYLGPDYLEPLPALYFVPDHVRVSDPTVGIVLLGADTGLDFNNMCESIGSYVRVFGEFNYETRSMLITKYDILKEPIQRENNDECLRSPQ